jgi:hypothetical protein
MAAPIDTAQGECRCRGRCGCVGPLGIAAVPHREISVRSRKSKNRADASGKSAHGRRMVRTDSDGHCRTLAGDQPSARASSTTTCVNASAPVSIEAHTRTDSRRKRITDDLFCSVGWRGAGARTELGGYHRACIPIPMMRPWRTTDGCLYDGVPKFTERYVTIASADHLIIGDCRFDHLSAGLRPYHAASALARG